MVINPSTPGLSLEELILPEILGTRCTPPYASAAIGKWHLGNHAGGGNDHPNLSGYSHFAGTLQSLPLGSTYYSWPKVVDGVPSTCTTYATTDNVDEALAWIRTAPEPWFCYLAFSAPHDPFHPPPPSLHTQILPAVDPRGWPRPFYRATVEAMDRELGRLLDSLGALTDRTNVIFLGDNGTPKEVCVPPFLPEHSKMTVYEGGVNVPLIIAGPAVVTEGAQCSALVNTTDLFSTVLDLAGAAVPAELRPPDSVSLVPYLSAPSLPSLRAWVFAEIFTPNGVGRPKNSHRAVRDGRFKLIRTRENPALDRLYDLWRDPFETVNLLGPGSGGLTGEAASSYQGLLDQLRALLWEVGSSE